jgi:hypothetical protein
MLSPRRQHAPLSGDGAARAGGRWNPRGVPALYFSADHGTAIAEHMQGGLIHPGRLAPFDVENAAILDLTDVAIRTSLAVDDALLYLPWRHARGIARRIPDSGAFADAATAAGRPAGSARLRASRQPSPLRASCWTGAARVNQTEARKPATLRSHAAVATGQA